MAADNQHIIKRIHAELQLSSAEDEAGRSEQLETALVQAVKKLGPLLDEASGEAYCRLDLLSVELNLQPDDWPRFENLLHETLTQEVGKVMAGNQAQTNQKVSELKFHKVEPEQRLKELAFHFLATGQFPWWGDSQSMEEIEKWLRDVPPGTWVEVIQPEARQNPMILHRLAVQFPQELAYELIAKSSKEILSVEEIIQFIRIFEHFVETQNLPLGRQRQILTQLREYALWGILFEHSRSELLAILTKTTLEELDSKYRDLWMEVIDKTAFTIDVNEQNIQRKIEQPVEEPDNGDKSFTEDDGISVVNAGIVLLYPFIGRLFGNLGLLEDGGFANRSTRERAVCLLHHLVTGEAEFFEPALTLPKFLCGWPLKQPVDRFLPISEYEKDECRIVLNSAIDQWEVLKSTTADGLRNNFLQRQGILKEEELGWLLHVERKTQDILLDKMPWGLSVVKFSWLDEMITVDWQ